MVSRSVLAQVQLLAKATLARGGSLDTRDCYRRTALHAAALDPMDAAGAEAFRPPTPRNPASMFPDD